MKKQYAVLGVELDPKTREPVGEEFICNLRFAASKITPDIEAAKRTHEFLIALHSDRYVHWVVEVTFTPVTAFTHIPD